MKQPTFRPLPSQGNTSDFLSAGSSNNPSTTVASGACVGSASALHAPSGAGDADRISGHPCLTSNNSIHAIDSGIELGSGESNKDKFNEWKDEIEPTLSSYHWKCAHRMSEIIRIVAEKWGQQSIGVMDLTFDGEDQPSYAYANRCLNSFMTNVFRPRYGKNYMVVCERGGKFGRFHFHILFSASSLDFRTGSFRTWTKAGKCQFHPNRHCRQEFEFLRPKLEGYGFGKRIRIQPLWDVGKGAKYFSKYIGKGHYHRSEDMKGRQLVRYGQDFALFCSMKFSKVAGVSSERRLILSMLGGRYGCLDLDELNELFGSRWQYYSGDQMRYMCGIRKGGGYAKQIDWLKGYMWNRYKYKLLAIEQENGWYDIQGAIHCTIKESEARNWLSKALYAPDEVYEEAGVLDKPNLFMHAWRELINKVECDLGEPVALDAPPPPNIIKIKQNENGKQNNERIGEDRGDSGRINETIAFPWE
jgi:hypothetical protein